jgi:LuxR family maltose regulon positive regulatory protein
VLLIFLPVDFLYMPQESLLQTKFFIPPLRHNLVPRSRLLAKLHGGLFPEIRLILVSAPAGFGKTTLVSEWLQNLPAGKSGGRQAFAWLTLDEADNNPARFWRYVDAALQHVDPRLGESIRPALSAPQPAPYRSLVTGIVDDIIRTEAQFILVLDDYHHIQDETIHDGINFFVDHLPPSVRLLITTRADPPLQLARRRSRGEMCEIRASDLRFTVEEITQLLNDVMRLDLSTEDLSALEKRTEGWIAGVQMAAISLQDVVDPHGFVTAFRGDDRYIADYLMEEVLQRQPVEFQQFLLQTSVLDRLNGPLCDAVTGRSDSRSVLNTLERANLFLFPLDNRREWFRYHQLFASLLYQRLVDANDPAAIKALKQRAGRWYADNGYVVEAVEILLACGDFQKAAEVIEKSMDILFMANELNLLVRWSEVIPEGLLATRPRLNVMAAWGSEATGHTQLAGHFIDILEKAIGITVEEFLSAAALSQNLSPLQRVSLIEVAVIRSRLAVDFLELNKAFSLGEDLLPYLVPGPPDEIRAFNYLSMYRGPQLTILGLVQKFRGNLAAASELMTTAEANAEVQKNPHIVALALGHLGEIQAVGGKLRQARKTFQQALELAREFPPNSTAFWGIASVGLGNLAFEQNDLVEAETRLKNGLELGKLWHVWECLLPGCVGQAHLHQTYGEWDQAYAILDELVELAALNPRAVEPAAEANKALLALRQGDVDRAARWATTFDTTSPSPYPLQWEQNALIAARIWLAAMKIDKAEALLARLLTGAKSLGHGRTVLEIQVLEALLAGAQNRPEKACQALLKAVKIAAPEGYLRLFLDEGELMRSLLEACIPIIREPASIEYATRLVRSFTRTVESRLEPISPIAPAAQKGIIEPLSGRELEVLRLMAEGLSNPAIAKRLYLSTNTLKAHAQSIYLKLDVHNRMEAVNKAREIGILRYS